MEKLIILLQACDNLLSSVHEQQWRYEVTTIRKKLEKNQDTSALQEILSWYEPDNSFNQLLLTKDSGHTLECDAEIDLNNTLDDLRSAIYEETQKLLKQS